MQHFLPGEWWVAKSRAEVTCFGYNVDCVCLRHMQICSNLCPLKVSVPSLPPLTVDVADSIRAEVRRLGNDTSLRRCPSPGCGLLPQILMTCSPVINRTSEKKCQVSWISSHRLIVLLDLFCCPFVISNNETPVNLIQPLTSAHKANRCLIDRVFACKIHYVVILFRGSRCWR